MDSFRGQHWSDFGGGRSIKNLGFDEGQQKRYSGFRKDDGPLTVQLLLKDTTLRGQD